MRRPTTAAAAALLACVLLATSCAAETLAGGATGDELGAHPTADGLALPVAAVDASGRVRRVAMPTAAEPLLTLEITELDPDSNHAAAQISAATAAAAHAAAGKSPAAAPPGAAGGKGHAPAAPEHAAGEHADAAEHAAAGHKLRHMPMVPLAGLGYLTSAAGPGVTPQVRSDGDLSCPFRARPRPRRRRCYGPSNLESNQ